MEWKKERLNLSQVEAIYESRGELVKVNFEKKDTLNEISLEIVFFSDMHISDTIF